MNALNQTQLSPNVIEQRYKAFEAIVPVVIYQTDITGKFLYLNERWTDFTAIAPTESIGHSCFQWVHPEDRPQAITKWQQAAKTKQALQQEYRLQLQDGSTKWVYDQVQPEFDSTGQVCGFIGSLTDISDRKQAEICLQETEQKFHSLFEHRAVGMAMASPDGHFIRVNQTMCDLLGYSPAEMVGMNILTIQPPDMHQEKKKKIQQLIKGTIDSFGGDQLFVQKDTTPIWVNVRVTLVRDKMDHPLYLLGIVQDIREQKQIELALSDSEQRFRRAIAEAPVPIMIHAEDGEVLQISSTWTNITGYTHTDIPTISAWIERAYSKSMASKIATTISQQYSLTSPVEEGDVTIRTHHGQQRIWSFSAGPLGKLPDGRRIAITMATDITEKQQAQIARQVSESRYRALLEVIPDLMIRQDAEGNYLDCIMSNDIKFIKPHLNLNQVNLYDILPLDLAEQRMAYVHQALKTGEIQIYDFEIEVEGESRWQEARIIAINQTEVLVIIRDISKRKLAEKQRQQTEESLRQIVEGTAAVTENDFFQELVQHIAAALDVRCTSITEATPGGFSVLAFCVDGHLQTAIEHCTYEQVPCCVQALQKGLCCYPDSLPKLYPGNDLFNELNAESYLGIGLRNSAGKPIGNLCIIHDRPLHNSEWMINLLKIFGARASAELERYQTARQLQVLTNELEQRVIERTSKLATTVEHLKTEIKRRQALENLLFQSQEQLQDIFDSAHDMIQSVSLADGSFEFVNRAWLETLGYTVQDLEHLTIFDVLHSSCRNQCQTLMKQLQTGQLQSLEQVEVTFVSQDGRIIEAEGNVNCRIVNGQSVYTRGFFRDISDRKKAEAKILKALERERELNEMKSRFVSNTSHEFRTPLTVISNNAELLKLFRDKLNETEQQQCLNTILKYVDHTTELIDEVLIVSKAECGKIALKAKSIDVVEFSQQLSHTISLGAPNHYFNFRLKDERSPSQKYDYYTQLDSKILQQSLTNLLTNAIKYSPEGSTVTFQLDLLPNTIQFRVIDEGIGIPEKEQKYLFEPFHRATNVGAIAGTGLGLSIVKHLITIHQGNINVQSTPGEGSCFTITIPTQWREEKPMTASL